MEILGQSGESQVWPRKSSRWENKTMLYPFLISFGKLVALYCVNPAKIGRVFLCVKSENYANYQNRHTKHSHYRPC